MYQQHVLPRCFFPLWACNVLILPLEDHGTRWLSEFHAQEIQDRFLGKKKNTFLRLYIRKIVWDLLVFITLEYFWWRIEKVYFQYPKWEKTILRSGGEMSSLSIFFIFKNRETDALMIMKVILMEPEHEWTLLVWVYSSTPSGESQVLLLLVINFKDYDLTNKGPENLKKKVCLLVLSWVNNNKKTHFVENISWMISTSGIS